MSDIFTGENVLSNRGGRGSRGRGRNIRGRGSLNISSHQYESGPSRNINELPNIGEYISPQVQKKIEDYMRKKQANIPDLTPSPNLEKLYSEVAKLPAEEYYLMNPTSKSILTLDNIDLHSKMNAWQILNKYFPEDQYIHPANKPLSRAYYEGSLLILQSAFIKHHYKNNELSYSQMNIQSIFPPEKWGDYNRVKRLKVDESSMIVEINYWDYIQAWDNFLLYQNKQKTHTWFFKFCPNFDRTIIPNWFLEWFNMHGPTVEYLPEEIKTQYLEYERLFPENINSEKPNYIWLQFIAQFNLPWIIRWDVFLKNNPIPEIRIRFYHKWWVRFDTPTYLINIKRAVEEMKTQHYESEMAHLKATDVLFDEYLAKWAHKIGNQTPDALKHKMEMFFESMTNFSQSMNDAEESPEDPYDNKEPEASLGGYYSTLSKIEDEEMIRIASPVPNELDPKKLKDKGKAAADNPSSSK